MDLRLEDSVLHSCPRIVTGDPPEQVFMDYFEREPASSPHHSEIRLDEPWLKALVLVWFPQVLRISIEIKLPLVFPVVTSFFQKKTCLISGQGRWKQCQDYG